MYRAGLNTPQALGYGNAAAHTQAGINHIQRRGIAQRVTAYITGKDSRYAFGGFFHREKCGAVRTPRAHDRRTDRQRRRRRQAGYGGLRLPGAA
jgi:hypothetical protein